MSDGNRDAPDDVRSDPPFGPRDQLGFGDGASAGRAVGAGSAESAAVPPAGEAPSSPSAATEAPEIGRMGLLDHLEELRKVLIQCLLAAGAAATLCWVWSGELLELIIRPVRDQGVYFMAPNDAFMARLKVALVAGLFAVAPFILFRAYGFVLPALHRRERRVATPVLLWTAFLFYTGVVFAFIVVAPYVVKFMMGFGTDTLKPLIGVGSYLGFVFQLCLGFGLVFELPIAIIAVCVAGIVRPQLLLRTWRYAVVIIAIISAIFTPPDLISQVMMMVPVLVLYLGSALVALVIVRRRDRARAAAEAAEGD